MAYKKSLSILRAITVLKCFTHERLTLSGAEIAAMLGLHKTTVYRVLDALASESCLERDPNTGRYQIGPATYALGHLYAMSNDLLSAAQPVMTLMAKIAEEPVNLGVRDKGNMVFIAKEEGDALFNINWHVGSAMPAYASAMGKSLLCELNRDYLSTLFPEESLPAMTSKTVATRSELLAELDLTRRNGFAVDEEGSHRGAVGIGAPIRGLDGSFRAAISLSVPVFRIDRSDYELIGHLVKQGASVISFRLGNVAGNGGVTNLEELQDWWERFSSENPLSQKWRAGRY